MEPSVQLDLSYATDFQPIAQKQRSHQLKRRHELKIGDPSKVLNTDFFDGKIDNPYTIFHVFRGFRSGDKDLPSTVTDRYWVQAPTTDSVIPLWKSITSYSGKIVVYTLACKVDALWKDLVEDHTKGELGFGLRCQTAYPQPKKDMNSRMLTIHIGNVFDIEQVGQVLYNLNYHLDVHHCRTSPLLVQSDFANEATLAYPNEPKYKEPVYTIKPSLFEDEHQLVPRALFMERFREQAKQTKYKARIDKVLSSYLPKT